jgi:hypothetical protein
MPLISIKMTISVVSNKYTIKTHVNANVHSKGRFIMVGNAQNAKQTSFMTLQKDIVQYAPKARFSISKKHNVNANKINL